MFTRTLFICVATCAIFTNTPIVISPEMQSLFSYPGQMQYTFPIGPQKVIVHGNSDDITILDNLDTVPDLLQNIDDADNEIYADIEMLANMDDEMCKNTYENAERQNLRSSKKGESDLNAETAIYGFTQHLSVPNLRAASYVTLSERLVNWAMGVLQRIFLNLYQIPKQRALYAKYFPNAKISLDDLKKNFPLVFLNQHNSLDSPLSNTIEVSGLHVNQQPDTLLLPADNVYWNKCFSESSASAYTNFKAFSTHIPTFGYQSMNIADVVKLCYALSIDITNIDETELKQKLDELLNVRSYTKSLQKISKSYRDQTMSSLEMAIYWAVNVLRHDADPNCNFVPYHHSSSTIVTMIGAQLLATIALIWVFHNLIKFLLNLSTKKIQWVKN